MSCAADSHRVPPEEDCRRGGWWVELEGVRIAELEACRPFDDDWDLYEVRSLCDRFDDSVLHDDTFWDREGIIFRPKLLPEVTVDDAICRWSSDLERIVVRYLAVRPRHARTLVSRLLKRSDRGLS